MVERVEPTAVTPAIVDPIPLAPVAVVVPPGAVTGTVVAVQGQNVVIPAGYAAGAEWQVMLPTAKVVQQSGLVGMAQLLGGADRIHINQRMMMFEALSCGMFEQKNKYDIRIGDKEGPTVMVATEESKPWTRLCCAPRHSAFVYFAPAYDQNNVLLTMERPGCKCDGCFDVMCCVNRPSPARAAAATRATKCASRRSRCTTAWSRASRASSSRTPGPSRSSASRCSAARRPWTAARRRSTSSRRRARRPTPRSRGPRSSAAAPSSAARATSATRLMGERPARSRTSRPSRPARSSRPSARTRTTTASSSAPGASEVDKANMIAGSVLLDYMFFEIDFQRSGARQPIDRRGLTCCLCFCWGQLNRCICICAAARTTMFFEAWTRRTSIRPLAAACRLCFCCGPQPEASASPAAQNDDGGPSGLGALGPWRTRRISPKAPRSN